jgi:hypothetical protein
MKQRCSLSVIVTTQYKGEEPTKEFKTLIGDDYADCYKQMDDFYSNMAEEEQEDLIYLMVTPAQYCVEFGKRKF